MRQRENERFPDDLFRERLEGHQLPVGDEVWNRLDNQLRSRQKSFVQTWKFPAAASVTVVLLAAGIWISGKGQNEESELISSEEFESTSMQEQPHMVHVPVATLYTSGGESSNTIVKISHTNEHPQDSNELSLGILSENSAEKTATHDRSAGKSFPEAQGGITTFSQRNDLESLTFSQNRDTPTSPAEGVVREPRVLVVHVAPAEPEPEVEVENTVSVAVVLSEADPGVSSVGAKQKKRGGVQRLLRQLRNAKTGEKIDWEELGLNQQRSIANVEHSPEN